MYRLICQKQAHFFSAQMVSTFFSNVYSNWDLKLWPTVKKYVSPSLGTISPMNSQMQFRFESYFNPVPRIIRPAFSYIGLAPRMQQYPFLTKYIDIYLVSVSPVPFILLFRLESCTTHTTQLQTFPQPMVLVASWATCGKT